MYVSKKKTNDRKNAEQIFKNPTIMAKTLYGCCKDTSITFSKGEQQEDNFHSDTEQNCLFGKSTYKSLKKRRWYNNYGHSKM